jgi:Secretion system C-terminal sorting domain
MEVFDFPVSTSSNRFSSQTPTTKSQKPYTNNNTPNTNYQLTNYPNPFNENTTIEAMLPANSNNAYLVIHDLTGREMYRTKLKGGLNKNTINSAILPKGIYIYHIEDEGIIQITSKLVKMK